MAERPGYLYTIEVEVLGADGNVSDVYRLPHGIRTVGTRADGSFLVNGQPFYFHGAKSTRTPMCAAASWTCRCS